MDAYHALAYVALLYVILLFVKEYLQHHQAKDLYDLIYKGAEVFGPILQVQFGLTPVGQTPAEMKKYYEPPTVLMSTADINAKKL